MTITIEVIQAMRYAKCEECGRVFDLISEDEAGEFYYGQDCEG